MSIVAGVMIGVVFCTFNNLIMPPVFLSPEEWAPGDFVNSARGGAHGAPLKRGFNSCRVLAFLLLPVLPVACPACNFPVSTAPQHTAAPLREMTKFGAARKSKQNRVQSVAAHQRACI